MKQVKRVFTLSKYFNGMHNSGLGGFDPAVYGTPSFEESLHPLHCMIEEIYNSGIPLGSKVEVVMKAKSKVKPKKKA